MVLRPIRIANGTDENAMLVFGQDERLVAILTQLGDEHGSDCGHWFLEVGFGSLDDGRQPTFPDLDSAQDWIRERVTGA